MFKAEYCVKLNRFNKWKNYTITLKKYRQQHRVVAQQKLKTSGNRVMAPFLACCCLTNDVKNATIPSNVISQYLTKREQQAYHMRSLASIIIHTSQVQSIAFNPRSNGGCAWAVAIHASKKSQGIKTSPDGVFDDLVMVDGREK